jgi:lipopolysaccharide export LptBFGC system permease protein LptF
LTRPSLTLWRYATIELWRLMLLTCAVLVVVIVFAAAVRYTAAGKLGPLETLRFMGLAMIPMLQYALPFAAGFGATLAYHRMAQDNELKAAAASGISHTALLGPALLSGLFLTLILTLLTSDIIPRYLRDMQKMVTEDMTKMVVGSIRSGQALDLDGKMIYADSVRELGPNENFREVLLLTGVMAIETDEQGLVQREVTAKSARVGFPHNSVIGDEQGETRTLMTIKLDDAIARERGKAEVRASTEPYTIALPGGMDDDPKFLTSRELAALPANPDRLNIIDSRRQQLAYHMAERQCIATIDAALKASGSVRMQDATGRRYLIRAGGMEWSDENERWELRPAKAGGTIDVEQTSAIAGESRRFSAKTGGMGSNLSSDAWDRSLTISLQLESALVEGGGTQPEWVFHSLLPTNNPLDQLIKLSSSELLAKVQTDPLLSKDAFVARPAQDLEKRIRKLNREILSKRHERIAFSISCFIMVVAGALTAMRLATSIPLAVYLWSFFPALLAVITISAGQQTTHQAGAGGLILLWGGVAILVGYVATAFAAVRKH